MSVRYLVCVSSCAVPTEPGRKPCEGGPTTVAGLDLLGGFQEVVFSPGLEGWHDKVGPAPRVLRGAALAVS